MTPKPQAKTIDEKIDFILARMEQTDPYGSRKESIKALITEAEDKAMDKFGLKRGVEYDIKITDKVIVITPTNERII